MANQRCTLCQLVSGITSLTARPHAKTTVLLTTPLCHLPHSQMWQRGRYLGAGRAPTAGVHYIWSSTTGDQGHPLEEASSRLFSVKPSSRQPCGVWEKNISGTPPPCFFFRLVFFFGPAIEWFCQFELRAVGQQKQDPTKKKQQQYKHPETMGGYFSVGRGWFFFFWFFFALLPQVWQSGRCERWRL